MLLQERKHRDSALKHEGPETCLAYTKEQRNAKLRLPDSRLRGWWRESAKRRPMERRNRLAFLASTSKRCTSPRRASSRMNPPRKPVRSKRRLYARHLERFWTVHEPMA